MIRWSADPTPQARATDSLETVARIMRDMNTDILPVTREGQLVGIITAFDIVTRMIAAGEDTWLARAADYMTCEVDTCIEGTPPREAMKLMADKQRRLLPIVNTRGQLIGALNRESLEAMTPVASAVLA